jgi:hypothetical protein
MSFSWKCEKLKMSITYDMKNDLKCFERKFNFHQKHKYNSIQNNFLYLFIYSFHCSGIKFYCIPSTDKKKSLFVFFWFLPKVEVAVSIILYPIRNMCQIRATLIRRVTAVSICVFQKRSVQRIVNRVDWTELFTWIKSCLGSQK